MALDYKAYVELFNTGDDAALVERFFADDCAMLSASGERRGKQGLSEFLAWAHDGVREVIRPQAVLSEGDLTFAEVDMDFHATKARPEFPFGPMFPGDLLTVKFFALYRSNADGKVVELKTSAWPPEQGVTKLPRLGAHPSQVAAFHAYAAAFSNGDCERFPEFYTEDVMLTLSSVGEIKGRQGIVDFYRPMFERVRESVTVENFSASDETIAIDAISRFTATSDAPDFVVAPLKRGEFVEVPVHVEYSLRDGLICRIDVTRNGERGPVRSPANGSAGG
ncbi:MAG TPA: nuclear transport factor 2 family protein [Sphingomonadaceae bacterium]|nr:nuclear transport factor 2 family protein [Sphingomonadaceae bacterium]